MSKPSSCRRLACAFAVRTFAAVVFALPFASLASAERITYTLLNYPAIQGDVVSPGIDMMTGTVVTDGTLGLWSEPNSHVVDASMTLSTPEGSFGEPTFVGAGEGYYSGEIYATPTQLLLRRGGCFGISWTGIDIADQTARTLDFYASNGYGPYNSPLMETPTWSCYLLGPPPYIGQYRLAGFRTSSQDLGIPAVPDPIYDYPDAWVIATATPEPATATLLGSALLGLGVVYLRRRWAARKRGH